MATQKPTRTARAARTVRKARTARTAPTPPKVGSSLSVRVTDEDMRDDLAVIMRAHGQYADPARTALRLLADAYRRAWDYQDVPDSMPPHIVAVRYAQADGTPEPVPCTHGTQYPHVREIPADEHDAHDTRG